MNGRTNESEVMFWAGVEARRREVGEKELSDPQAHRHTSRLSRGLPRSQAQGGDRGARTAVVRGELALGPLLTARDGSQVTVFLASEAAATFAQKLGF